GAGRGLGELVGGQYPMSSSFLEQAVELRLDQPFGLVTMAEREGLVREQGHHRIEALGRHLAPGVARGGRRASQQAELLAADADDVARPKHAAAGDRLPVDSDAVAAA